MKNPESFQPPIMPDLTLTQIEMALSYLADLQNPDRVEHPCPPKDLRGLTRPEWAALNLILRDLLDEKMRSSLH